jgi:hypothetical protein
MRIQHFSVDFCQQPRNLQVSCPHACSSSTRTKDINLYLKRWQECEPSDLENVEDQNDITQNSTGPEMENTIGPKVMNEDKEDDTNPLKMVVTNEAPSGG